MSDERDTVRMFWWGGDPGPWERISIVSFLKAGHRVEVHAYGKPELPDGAVAIDAAQTLPREEVFFYAKGPGAGSVSAFSNLFRYRLLADRGGTYSDMDVLCLRSLGDLPRLSAAYQGEGIINGAVLRSPAGHDLPRQLYRQAVAAGRGVQWGEIGPRLITKLASGHSDFVALPATAFYPVPFREAALLVDPDALEMCRELTEGSHAVHWWNEILRRLPFPKDRLPPRGSYLGEAAHELLGTADHDHWPAINVRTWVARHRLFRDNEAAVRAIEELRSGAAGVADFLRDCGRHLLDQGQLIAARRLLQLAHAERREGQYIARLLVEAHCRLGELPEADAVIAGMQDDSEFASQARQLRETASEHEAAPATPESRGLLRSR